MPDPGKSVPAEVKYELIVQGGPWKFKLRGETFDVPTREDIAVIVRRVVSGGLLIEEKIVGVIGGEHRSDCTEFLRLRQFLDSGGVIGLDKHLSYK